MKKLSFLIITSIVILVFAVNTSAAGGDWQYDANGWWYLMADDSYPADEWECISGAWYHFDENGYMQTGWVWDGCSWYYCNPDGAMATGWIWDNGFWYHLDENGEMTAGWLYENGSWYYMQVNGIMATGWLYDHDSWYYLWENGTMAIGTVVTDGVRYFFDETGKWTGEEHGEGDQWTDENYGEDSIMDPRTIPAGTVLSEEQVMEAGVETFFYVEEISNETFARMWGRSYTPDCTVPREDLRYIRCLHRDINGTIKTGELVMHRVVAETVCQIFLELFYAWYPIESMLLVDEFNASDDDSILANNTSAFNYRTIDDTDELSMHAYGLAIDINPYVNVYYIPSEGYLFPPDGWQYLDRNAWFPYKLEAGDLCYELFTQAGFSWGGWWTYSVDYQHFQYEQ